MALKRQQAAEDALALSFRVVATGASHPFLPQGPIFGLPVTEPKVQEEKGNTKFQANCYILLCVKCLVSRLYNFTKILCQ